MTSTKVNIHFDIFETLSVHEKETRKTLENP